MKEEKITTYSFRERFSKYVDAALFKGARASSSIVDVVLVSALRDKVEELLLTPEEYECMREWLVHWGQWSWDGKTFMSMKITVMI